jgi:ubiquinone/menaquinone biosynthesis C-methylase UbiE
MDCRARDYTDVTEMAGEEISREQLFRLANRYYWAGNYVEEKDVIEVACGTGPGLGYILERAKSLRAGDYSRKMVDATRSHYGDRIACSQFDAQQLPFSDNSADVILIFEAIYYLGSAEAFIAECKRVLRPSGHVLVSSANSDLFDFNPSPHSVAYYGVTELAKIFASAGFNTLFWGSTPVAKAGLRQRIMRPLKRVAVSVGLMPKSMAGKRVFKRIVFGKPVFMPCEITAGMVEIESPKPLSAHLPDNEHKVIYCAAQMIG